MSGHIWGEAKRVTKSIWRKQYVGRGNTSRDAMCAEAGKWAVVWSWKVLTDTEKVRHCYIIMGSKDEHGLLPMPWEDNSFDTMDSGLQRQNFRDRDQFRGYWNDRDGEQEGPNWAATSATRGTFEHHWVRESKRPRWVTVHLKWPISLAGNTKYCHTISVVIKCPKHSSRPLGAHLCLPPW